MKTNTHNIEAGALAEKNAQFMNKYGSLIEACEFGSESGAQEVMKIIAERDELAKRNAELLAALKDMLPDSRSIEIRHYAQTMVQIAERSA